eukprot:RCo042233
MCSPPLAPHPGTECSLVTRTQVVWLLHCHRHDNKQQPASSFLPYTVPSALGSILCETWTIEGSGDADPGEGCCPVMGISDSVPVRLTSGYTREGRLTETVDSLRHAASAKDSPA